MGVRKDNVIEMDFARDGKLVVNDDNTYYTYNKKSTYKDTKEIEKLMIKSYMKLLSR